jgi:hypothetical protein
MSKRAPNTSRDALWQRLTLATLALTALVSLGYLAIFIQPGLLGGLLPNTGPAPTLVQALALPTPTATHLPTDTPLVSWTPLPTRTPWPTDTPNPPTPSPSPGPSPTFLPTLTPRGDENNPDRPLPTRSNYPFALQSNEIVYTQYFFSSECNWLGIAGQVVDKKGHHIVGLPVVLNGGGFQNVVTYSGDAPAYGRSGWEHFIDDQVKEGDFTIQLYDNQGQPISDQVQVRTRADCRTNLIVLIFELNWDEYVP